MSEHPSYFALDTFALSRVRDAAIEAHVASCPACAQHVAAVSPTAEAPPAWVNSLRRPVARLWPAAFGLVAIAAAILFAIVPPSETTTTRGAPSVGIYIRREGHVFLWDGAAPVRAGDSLRVKVAPEEAAHVAVYSRTESGLTPLVSQRVRPREQTLLDGAWQIDGAGEREQIVVAFSSDELDPELVAAATRGAPIPEGIFVRTYVLPKE